MTAYLSIFCFLAGLCFVVNGTAILGPNTWVVLVASSKGWYNYRHQADICHAYHTLIKKGIQKEKIITVMYDDVANDEKNPNPGTLINIPGGEDVYHGVEIDYKGNAVTPENFLHILEGNEKAMKNIGSGRVLKSTGNDTVFVNIADRGGTGVVAFPTALLMASDLVETINVMRNKNMFDKLILYIEGCESGSMFDNLINHLPNVVGITGTAPGEPSRAWYCEDEKYFTCLTDVFGRSWMERLDKLNNSESLFDNYNALRPRMRGSHVQIYGDYRLGFLDLFESDVPGEQESLEPATFEEEFGVNGRRLQIHFASMEVEAAKDPATIIRKKKKLQKIIKARNFAVELIHKILDVYTGRDEQKLSKISVGEKVNLDMFSCYGELINTFQINCFNIAENTFFLEPLFLFANICSQDLVSTKAAKAIESVCQKEKENIKNIDIKIE